ncbi:sensor histidine kinase [Fodinibius halophilus]|uniref:histidine kinase n=1 Tax=Fodinibius halophilus TaxID=1736908 RepID=A0A6M1SUF3_9BACT|nr:HAMP domain-containing sensor histidine kinase [Fodinibius halophilus]NGP87588.1 HAMP domain-containing histidine kinase [Fodinibius halophilus]
MKRYGSLRWLLLAVGIIAIIGLTGMNVYSLYALHENTLESNRENKKLQIAEFSDKIRYRFFESYYGLSSIDIKHLKSTFRKTGKFSDEVISKLNKAADDKIFDNIYFIPSDSKVCQQNEAILRYNDKLEKFVRTSSYPELVCDGMGISRTQMKSLIDDYKYSNKVIFDSHRSVTIAILDPSEKSIFGYLTMPFNQDYLRNEYLPKKLAEKFGTPDQSDMHVWLRDWVNDEIIASSDTTVQYDHEKVQFEQDFPSLFDYWELQVAFTDQSAVAASNASLIKNITVLGAAMLLLIGALVFMFRSAQKERALAQRQAGFLANVTHELKTPLAVMQAAGENLADGRVTDKTRLKNYGNHIFNEAVRLRKMIEKLLDVAKADAGQSLVEPEPINLAKKLHSYIDEHKKYIEKKGFTLHTTIEENLPMVMVDPNSFETIVSNLVENAIKYSTDEKFIHIRLKKEDEKLVLQVEDHGVGMNNKVTAHIFEKFFRAEDTLTAKTKGHGLGLSIVSNLVELNDGDITVSSTPEEGSTFTITFPVILDEEDTTDQPNTSYSTESDSLNKESEIYVN